VSVVVEAGARSGALNTAHHAGQLGRPVFAVPGPYSSASSVGCHRLIADRRAEIVVHPRDPADAAVRAWSGHASDTAAEVPIVGARVDPDVLRAVDALSRRRPAPLDEVARRSGLSLSDATDALALAELQGLVERGPSGWTAR
jgi:DNA processing protein